MVIVQFEHYTILRELSPAKSFLARDACGRSVVLKVLPTDCLLEGQLNPNIAQRLPPVPEMGTLNLDEVLLSPYFFS